MYVWYKRNKYLPTGPADVCLPPGICPVLSIWFNLSISSNELAFAMEALMFLILKWIFIMYVLLGHQECVAALVVCLPRTSQ